MSTSIAHILKFRDVLMEFGVTLHSSTNSSTECLFMEFKWMFLVMTWMFVLN